MLAFLLVFSTPGSSGACGAVVAHGGGFPGGTGAASGPSCTVGTTGAGGAGCTGGTGSTVCTVQYCLVLFDTKTGAKFTKQNKIGIAAKPTRPKQNKTNTPKKQNKTKTSI